MTSVAAPTIDDARRAARALAGAGARQVMVFGSVARGDAHPYSDIDLVAVFDDVDYSTRQEAKIGLNRLASVAAGHIVEVWVTDVPEWAAQNRRAASFAAAIRDDLVAVASSPGDDSAVRWEKEQVMATSDTEAAYRRLKEAHRQLRRIARLHGPDGRERLASGAGDADEHYQLLTDRLVQVCTAAAMAIETALKALGSDAMIDPRTLYSHDIAHIVEQLPPADEAAARTAIIDSAIGSFDRVSVWRTIGDYLPDDDEPQPEDLATVSFTAAMASAATALSEFASNKIAGLHGRREINDSIAVITIELRARARSIDIATGEPKPGAAIDDQVPGL